MVDAYDLSVDLTKVWTAIRASSEGKVERISALVNRCNVGSASAHSSYAILPSNI